MPSPTTLADLYKGWDAFQELLVQAVSPLTGDQLDLAVEGDGRPAWRIAAHIISARQTWFRGALHVEADNWDPARAHWDWPDAPKRSASELVDGLQYSWTLVHHSLKSWTPDMLTDVFQSDRGGHHREFTRQWVIWHVLEHDLFHGGELFLLLGSHGIAVPDI